MVTSDLSEIPSSIIQTKLTKIVENQLQSSNYNINVSSASQSGANNFLGIVYRVGFSRENENDKNKTSNLILKVAPTNEARRAQFFARPSFLRENFIYNEVLPYFREFELSKGVITEENGFNEYPKCYGNVSDDLSECIFLEDLSVRGFSIIDRYTEEITAEHVRLAMQALAKFHAISFALKDQHPEKFNEFASQLEEIFIRQDDVFLREYFDKNKESIINVLSSKEDVHLLAKIEKLFEKNPIDVAAECLDLKSTGAGAIISHGDSWQNNLMFRYDNSGKPIEINLIDFQMARHASPIIDIVYFMFCCTTKELRDAHYENFLKVYHETLSAHIQRLGSDPDKLFPYELMLEHFRKFAKFGLVLANCLLPMITADDRNGINIDELCDEINSGKEVDTKVFISEQSEKKLNKRLRDVVVDMVRLEYI